MPNEVFILDSNIWISYVITKRLQNLVTIIRDHHLTVLTSQPLVKEIQAVLSRPKFTRYINHADINEVITLHLKLCRLVETEETADHLIDSKDNFLINLFNKGKATVIVSGDKELLKEAGGLGYNMMTLKEFELSYHINP